MPIIRLTTLVNASVERVFDLSRCIDLHESSMSAHGEKAVAGITAGLISPGETVTWRAKHFGIWQHLTSRITKYDRPNHFRDSMVKGAFKRFDHDHFFTATAETTTEMIDVFDYASPLGLAGKIVDALILKSYMTQLLEERNRVVKAVAESEQWRKFLSEQS